MSASGTRVAALLAGSAVAGLLAAVVISDVAQEDPETTPAVNAEDAPNQTIRPVPVVESGDAGGALSQAVGLLVLSTPDGETIGGILGTWGAVLADAVEEEPPTGDGEVDDPRLFGAEIGPVFTDPCIDDPEGDGCPDPAEVIPAVVEGDPPLGPNAAVVHAFPRPDAELAAECGFDGLAPDELPIAVATANPGTVALTVGAQTFTDVASEDEIAEFEEWRSTGEVPRPPSSFVAHCLAVPAPDDPGPGHRAGGRRRRGRPDGPGRDHGAALAGRPAGPDGHADRRHHGPRRGPARPRRRRRGVLRAGRHLDRLPAELRGRAAGHAGDRLAPRLVGPLSEEPPSDAAAPYLEASPRVRRVTLALPEGEPSLVCITPVGVEAAPVGLTVVPPDARRLTLGRHLGRGARRHRRRRGPRRPRDLLAGGAGRRAPSCSTDVPSGTMEPGPARRRCAPAAATPAPSPRPAASSTSPSRSPTRSTSSGSRCRRRPAASPSTSTASRSRPPASTASSAPKASTSPAASPPKATPCSGTHRDHRGVGRRPDGPRHWQAAVVRAPAVVGQASR